MIEDQFRKLLADYREDITLQLRLHAKLRGVDGTLYNTITGVVLLCTALLSTLPGAETGLLFWTAKTLAVLSMFLVALDRTLDFTRFSRHMIRSKLNGREVHERHQIHG